MENGLYTDEYFMKEALREARKAFDSGEVPVGAVVTEGTRIIARAHNMTQQLHDVTAHAEMIAITAASNHLGAKYLMECTLFVTLEPCLMCASAMKWAQLGRLIYGAADPGEGFSQTGHPVLHPRTEIRRGVLTDQCSALLKQFFADRRD